MSRNSIISIAQLLELSNVEDKNTPIAPEAVVDNKDVEPTPISTSKIESVTSLKELVEVLDSSTRPSNEVDNAVLTSAITFKVSELLTTEIGDIVKENLNSVITEEVGKLVDVSPSSKIAEVSEEIDSTNLEKKLSDNINERLSDIVMNTIRDEIAKIDSYSLNPVTDSKDPLTSVELNGGIDSSSLNSSEDGIDPINSLGLNDSMDSNSAVSDMEISTTVSESLSKLSSDILSVGAEDQTKITDLNVGDISFDAGDVTPVSLQEGEDITYERVQLVENEDSDTALSNSGLVEKTGAVIDIPAYIEDTSIFQSTTLHNFIPNLVSIFTESSIGALVRDLLDTTSLVSNFKNGVASAVQDAMESVTSMANEAVNHIFYGIDETLNGALTESIAVTRDIMNFDIKSLANRITGKFRDEFDKNDVYDTVVDRDKILRTSRFPWN